EECVGSAGQQQCHEKKRNQSHGVSAAICEKLHLIVLCLKWCESWGPSISGRLLEQVDDAEQTDPDDIDEVHVIGHAACEGGFVMAELLRSVGSSAHEQDADESDGHVDAVEPCGQVEDRPVAVGVDGDALADE